MSQKRSLIADAKQKLAQQRAARGIGTGGEAVAGRLPPGQKVVDSTSDFPVLDLGVHPQITQDAWRLELYGACEGPAILSWKQFNKIGSLELTTDFHCVTAWSTYDMRWRGTPMSALIAIAQPRSAATHVMFHGSDGYSTNVPLADCLRPESILATHWNDQPLETKHGGPVRGMIAHLYAWKSAKWLCGIEFMAGDRPGYWEERGYHMYGDPFREQRYSDRAMVERRLAEQAGTVGEGS